MWDILITADPSTTGVGTIFGTWTDVDGSFSFSERCPIDVDGQDAFIERAIQARDEWKKKISGDKALASSMMSRINSTDKMVAGVK